MPALSATVPIKLPPSKNSTFPVAPVVTVAVKVTTFPYVDVLPDVANVVVEPVSTTLKDCWTGEAGM